MNNAIINGGVVDFVWSSVTGVTYRLQVSNDETFSSIDFNIAVALNYYTDVIYTGLPDFWWRVRSEKGSNVSAWSSVRHFFRNPPY